MRSIRSRAGAESVESTEKFSLTEARSAVTVESALRRFVRPKLGSLPVHNLRRSHVAKLLDHVEDSAGPVQADRVRAYLHRAMAWWSERDDVFNFSAAFVKATPRANASDRARTRVLSDDEIRAIWRALPISTT